VNVPPKRFVAMTAVNCRTIHIDLDSILAVSTNVRNPDWTTLIIACGQASEEWNVLDSVESVLLEIKLATNQVLTDAPRCATLADNANKPKSG
jgi:hypothetical protein